MTADYLVRIRHSAGIQGPVHEGEGRGPTIETAALAARKNAGLRPAAVAYIVHPGLVPERTAVRYLVGKRRMPTAIFNLEVLERPAR